MGVPVAVQRSYDDALELLRELEGVVEPTVQKWASDHDYLFKGRIKQPESLSEKLETGRYASWLELDDLYACTVVIPTALHIDDVLAFLRGAFVEHAVRGQGISKKPPDLFRFDAPRFIGTLAHQPESERSPGLETILFEVQILTAFEYAWVVATHDLVFKGGHVDWRRARLAAHLKAAAEEADALIASFELAATAIPVSPHPDTNRRERLAAFFTAEFEAGRLPATLEPGSQARLCENISALLHSYARDRIDDELDLLLDDLQACIAADDVPMSGSLFQLVVGLVHQRVGTGALRRFVIVESPELRDLHGVVDVPKPFVFAEPPV